MVLQTAAETLLKEIRALSEWESELRRDLTRTCVRRADLTGALDAVLRSLPAPERQPLQAALMALGPQGSRPRKARNKTAKTEAAHAFLAEATGEITSEDLQAQLVQSGLAPRPGAAAILLARKVGQGMVERTGHGRYRVNAAHPEIVARRVRRL